MKKKIIKWIIFILILFAIVFVGIKIFNYIKPMLVTGKIVEIDGTIEEVKDDYILIIDKNNIKYKCFINENTYYPNGYAPLKGDNVIAIYDYDEKILEENESLDIKEVIIKRIYKNKKT